MIGNTSLSDQARAQDGEQKSRWQRLMDRLSLSHLAGLAFFGEPNDIAVSVVSAQTLPAGDSAPTVRVIPCDHVTYFSHEEGIRALTDVLRPA